MMATFSVINTKTQTAGRLARAIAYATQPKKTTYEGQQLVSGHNCQAASVYPEMMITTQRFRKADKMVYYHFTQSFSDKENVTPQQAHQVALELAAELFPEFEALVATHVDTDNVHSHIIVNSVSFETGMKLHQNEQDLVRQRAVNDQVCKRHNLSVLPPYEHGRRRIKPGEYRAAERGESWKFALIRAIDEALEYANDRQSFIESMEYEGYEVIWKDEHKYITYVTPEDHRCRDRSLYDEMYLKENMEKIFAYRAIHGFTPGTPEPPQGWLAVSLDLNKSPLACAIDYALTVSADREAFIDAMAEAGYYVLWESNLDHIAYLANGKCTRDYQLNDPVYLKENMELIFDHRAEHGFVPGTPAPATGWLSACGDIANQLIFLGKHIEQANDQPLTPAPTPRMSRNERLKRLAMGQKLSSDDDRQQGMSRPW